MSSSAPPLVAQPVRGALKGNPPRRGGFPRGRRSRAPGFGTGLIFIGPNLVGMALFTVIPMAGVIALAFTKWDLVSGLEGIRFVGLDNFAAIVRDAEFWRTVLRTVVYAGVAVPVSVLLGLGLALALNRDIPGKSVLRAVFFLPYIVNVVAIGMTWLMIMNPSRGLLNQFLSLLGLPGPAWFASSAWALPALIVIAIWSNVGYAALIYLAALQDSPADLYEAASLDGAGRWTQFRVITWPALIPTTVFLLVTVFLAISQSFGLIALITSGGPGKSTTTLSYLMYEEAFRLYHFGLASAIGLVTFAITLALTLVTWRVQRGRSLHE